MGIHLWGTDFRRSSQEFRSRLYIPLEKREAVLKKLCSEGFVDLVYLHTCNRVEFYTTARNHYTDMRKFWLKLLCTLGLDEEESFFRGYATEGKAALRHILRVACSLESMVVGEPQILGQMKDALSFSQQFGLVRPGLERCFSVAFETAKKVRSSTQIGERSVSVAALGLQRLQRVEAQWPLESVVVVGRSPMSLFVLRWLLSKRPSCPVLWVNRSVERLNEYPEAKQVKIMPLGDFLANPVPFSHLFTATSSSEPVFNTDFFRRCLSNPKMIFDFAHPADVGGCPSGTQLIHLEDLIEEASENQALRKVAMEQAETAIEEAMKEYFLATKEAPVLRDFSSAESLFMNQLDEALQSLQVQVKLPPEYCSLVQQWAKGLVKKNLHCSKTHLRKILRKAADSDVPTGTPTL
ncbi:MAG: hypothetical protein HY537_11590 [Deltaproteobacteria bacterium]|nr:hypothetical protein [Deltaproteobacteria bacterium]